MRYARVICAFVPLWSCALVASAADRPAFSEVQATVNGYFSGLKDHQAADLISRGQAEAVLDQLQTLGWKAPDGKEILQAVLEDRDPLVKRLRTRAGRKFMRQAARYPQAYDRLDHLERLSDGRRILDQLIDGPDGYKLIEYLTTSSGGQNLGKMLSAAPQGERFNQPTGRIYTQAELLVRLKRSYEAE